MKTNQKNGFETTPQRGYIEANKSDLNTLHELGKWNNSTHHLKQQLIKEQSDTVDSYTGLKTQIQQRIEEINENLSMKFIDDSSYLENERTKDVLEWVLGVKK